MVGEQKNKKMASVVFHVFSCLLGFIMIYPLLWLVASSFKSNDTMFKNTYSLLPESWGIIKNYNSGFASTTGYSFGHFFMNSAIVTVIGVVCTIFSFLLAAYAVSRVKFFGANFWFEKAPPQRYVAGHDPAVGIRRCVLRLFDRAVHARHPQRAG